MQMDIPLRALEILLQGRRLNRSALSRAQRESQSSGRPLEQILLEAGEFDRETWLEAASQAAGVPGFNLQSQKVSASWAQTITREVAEQIPALPVARQEGQLVVVLQDPTDTFALGATEHLTKHPISPRVTYNPDPRRHREGLRSGSTGSVRTRPTRPPSRSAPGRGCASPRPPEPLI